MIFCVRCVLMMQAGLTDKRKGGGLTVVKRHGEVPKLTSLEMAKKLRHIVRVYHSEEVNVVIAVKTSHLVS